MSFKTFLCFILYSILLSSVAVAQGIKLNNVAKVKVSISSGGGFANGRYFEVLNDNDTWKSYLTRHVEAFSTDSTKQLVRLIPQNIVAELVEIFNHPDTKVNVDHFDLDEAELRKYVDTVNAQLKPYQKAEFIKALQSKSILKDAITTISEPEQMDHSMHCSIALVTKDNKSYEIYADPYAYLDYQVWRHGETKYFNPAIHRIFNFFRLKDKETAGAKKRLYKDIANEVYTRQLKTKFHWNDLKDDEPASFSILSKTMKPIRLVGDKKALGGEFSSSRLPRYVKLWTNFKRNDTSAINLFKRQEDTIVHIIKKARFLIEHYNNYRGTKVLVSSESDGKHKPYFRFSMTADNGNQSEWLVVDNNSVVLLNYSGDLKDPFSNKFEGIVPNQKNRFAINRQAYLIFDFDGNWIGGNKSVGHSDLIFK